MDGVLKKMRIVCVPLKRDAPTSGRKMCVGGADDEHRMGRQHGHGITAASLPRAVFGAAEFDGEFAFKSVECSSFVRRLLILLVLIGILTQKSHMDSTTQLAVTPKKHRFRAGGLHLSNKF